MAAVDASLGDRVVLIGLLIAGPCCVVLTGEAMRHVLWDRWTEDEVGE